MNLNVSFSLRASGWTLSSFARVIYGASRNITVFCEMIFYSFVLEFRLLFFDAFASWPCGVSAAKNGCWGAALFVLHQKNFSGFVAEGDRPRRSLYTIHCYSFRVPVLALLLRERAGRRVPLCRPTSPRKRTNTVRRAVLVTLAGFGMYLCMGKLLRARSPLCWCRSKIPMATVCR